LKTIALIPAYNAGKTIEEVINRIPREYIDQLIVVDDGSQDCTYSIIKQFKWVTVIQHETNLGYGSAQITLHRAALDAGADYIVILHADLGHSPEEIPQILEPLKQGNCDIVQGSRILGIKSATPRILGSNFWGAVIKGPMPGYKYIANCCLTFFQNIAFGTHFTDFHTGFRACTREALFRLEFNKFMGWYLFDTEFLLESHINGLKICEVPVTSCYDDRAASSVPSVRYGLKIMQFAAQYRFNQKGRHK